MIREENEKMENGFLPKLINSKNDSTSRTSFVAERKLLGERSRSKNNFTSNTSCFDILDARKESSEVPDFCLKESRLEVDTYVLLLELSNIDVSTKTFKAWVEIGFQYDVHDYLQLFNTFTLQSINDERCRDSMTSSSKNTIVYPQDITIPFDIVNATEMTMRSEAHFIRATDKGKGNFYSSVPDINDSTLSISEAEKLISFIDLENCPRRQFRKFETRTYIMELSFFSMEQFFPFEEIHLFFKLITSDCRVGTDRITFNYNAEESDFAVDKYPNGYYAILNELGETRLTVSKGHSYGNANTRWDRLYLSVTMKRSPFEGVINYYVVPFLLYNYLIIRPIGDQTDTLIGTSITIVLSNVALLIVSQNNVFSFNEQAVAIQIGLVIFTTYILSIYPMNQFILLAGNIFVSISTLCFHYLYASKKNNEVEHCIETGDFKTLQIL